MVQILEKIEGGDGELVDLELLESIVGAHPRQVALRARRLRRLPGLELHRARGATSSSPTSSRAAARTTASRRSRGSSPVRATAPVPHTSQEPAGGDRVSTSGNAARARHDHGRRRRGPGAEGHRPRRGGARAGIEIPVFCYEPRLGPPVGACRMCLCEVAPGPPKPQAACTLTAADGMVVKTRRHLADGRRGAERDARVHPRQPPARLPGLRQGRRVPAAGPDLPLRPRQHAHDVPEADVREADPDLADDRARPRALHPLLPLHPLLRGGRRGRPARRAATAARARSSRRSRTSPTARRSPAT